MKQYQFMILKNKDIAAFKVNWKEKSFNIRQLSKELFLGLDSFVFWDDNPIERDKVKSKLPNVQVVDVSDNVYDWQDKLYLLDEFAKSEITKEDLKKTIQYRYDTHAQSVYRIATAPIIYNI